MFTGIITDVGEVIGREDGRFTIRSRYRAQPRSLGASIGLRRLLPDRDRRRAAGAGCRLHRRCLQRDRVQDHARRTGSPARRVNLERALRAGDELGGHIVSGHVDGVARILDITPDGDSRRFSFEAPEHLARYIAPKGSVALDGISLTVTR